jgi:hypothetical protein
MHELGLPEGKELRKPCYSRVWHRLSFSARRHERTTSHSLGTSHGQPAILSHVSDPNGSLGQIRPL